MKSIIDIINENWTDGKLDKSVKAPERKKVHKAIYKEIEANRTTGHLYRDSSWEGVRAVRQDVQNALDKLNSNRSDGYQYEVSIAPDNGGYRKTDDGLSQWKQYKVELYKVHKDYKTDEEYPEPFMLGTLNCHAAGSVEDPFSAYDMSFCISY